MGQLTPELANLQDLILGKKTGAVSTVDTKTILSLETTSEIILLIMGGLSKGVMDKDVALIQAINNTRTMDNLILVGLALRHGANPNIYVNSDIGIAHILVYTYSNLTGKADEDTLDTLITMLLLSGSTFTSKAFDPSKLGQFVKDNKSTFSDTNIQPSVIEWLKENNYETIIPSLIPPPSTEGELELAVNNQEMVNDIAIILDKPSLLDHSKIKLLDAREVIRDQSSEIMKINLEKESPAAIAQLSLLTYSRFYYNITAYRMILEKGVQPDYTFINDLLTRMKRTKDAGFIIGFNQLEAMLQETVIRGISIDTRQLNYLRTIDIDAAERLIKAYEYPYWQKVCQVTKGEVEDQLKFLALSLNIPNIESDKEEICTYINGLAQKDPEKLKTAAVKRQELRVAATALGVSEYIESGSTVTQSSPTVNIPLRVCRNRNVLMTDPYQYNDAQVAFYVDDKEVPWCYTYDMFKELLKIKVNPTTGDPLPEDFITELKNKDRALTSIGITPVDTLTFSRAVEKLSEKDVINDTITEHEINKFLLTAKTNAVDGEKYRNFTQQQMQDILQRFGRSVNLFPLTQDHAFATMTIVSNGIFMDDPRIIPHFFNA